MSFELAGRTGYRFLTCQIKPIQDTDVVDGQVVTKSRVAVSFSEYGSRDRRHRRRQRGRGAP